jgi:type II secretory pathway pseudopilin PulG
MRTRNYKSAQGFTMVEIALCLAIVGFALVAIIGVLPMGIQVQSDNRQDSIINHDGAYFLDAIRNGAPPDDLRLYVENISMGFSNNPGPGTWGHITNVFRDNHHIIGLLSNPNTITNVATVRALSGAASEKGDYTNDVAFKYKIFASIRPLESLNPDLATNASLYTWQTNLAHEVRLVFRYPLTFDGKMGAGRKVFRTIVSGRMNPHPDESVEYFFYRSGLNPTNFLSLSNNIYAL